MIDKKKIVQRQNKGSRLKDMPLTNFAILVIVLIQVLGQGLKIYPLQLLKPVPMILMIFYIHYKNKLREHLVPRLVQIGLVICLIGDIFLMFNQISQFIIGTCFFLVGHIFFVVAFSIGPKVRHLSKKWRIIRRIVYLIIVLLTFNLIYNLWDVFPNKPIYICYGAILATQVIVSLKRYEITAEMSFYFPIAGVVLFSISDNLLAFLKFNAIKSDLGRSIIMLTYYSSQYFIMHGSLHQSNLKFELDQVKKS